MRKLQVFLILLAAILSLSGCSPSPGKTEATKLAHNYISGFVPGVQEKDISILKTYEKDGNTIVAVQAGGMLCDMAVIKGKDGWMGRGISCNGKFETPEKEAERYRDNLIASLNKKVEEMNKEMPSVAKDGITRNDKAEFLNNKMRFYRTILTVASSTVDPQKIDEFKKSLSTELCSKKSALEFINSGFAYEYIYNDKDGKPLFTHLVDKDVCGKL